MQNTNFDWKNFLKLLASIAIPVALQNLLTTTGSMIDTMMLAPLGENSVGAVGLCAQFSSLMFSCYWGFVGGGMLFFSQYWGAKDYKNLKISYGTTLTFLMIVSLIYFSLATFFPQFVMKIYTDKEIIQKIGVKYLRTVGTAYIFQVFSVAMSSLLRSTEQVKIPLIASIVSVLTNIFLNWVFIYGNLGFNEMGVQGAALATTIAAIVNAVIILIASKIYDYEFIFSIKEHFLWTKKWLKEYLGKCFPIICNELLVGIGFTVTNIVLGRQSVEAIAAVAVFRTFEGFVIAFFMGLSNAASVLVGKCVGSGDLRTAYERAKRIVLVCAVSISMVCLIIILVSNPLLTKMSLQGESLRIGTGFIRIYSIAAIIRMCNWCQNDIYRSAGDATYGTVLEIAFMYLMVIPLVCLTGLYLHTNIFIVFGCCYCDEIIRFCLMQKHMYSGKWIKPVTNIGKQQLPLFLKELKNR